MSLKINIEQLFIKDIDVQRKTCNIIYTNDIVVEIREVESGIKFQK